MIRKARWKKIFLVGMLLLAGIFLAGRFGWKLLGFRACQGAGIETVEVHEDMVRITGYYPGSFPEGFCGYYAREYDGKLYVGFRFSAVFGVFETGNFDVTIPVRGEINEVLLKTRIVETRIWTAENGFLPQSEQYGVVLALGEFQFDADKEKMFLTFTADGKIEEDLAAYSER